MVTMVTMVMGMFTVLLIVSGKSTAMYTMNEDGTSDADEDDTDTEEEEANDT